MPYAPSVSRHMGMKFDRASSRPSRVKGAPFLRSGFEVRPCPTEPQAVVVEYSFGEQLRYAPQERRDEVRSQHLTQYREHLELRYLVTDDAIGDGPCTKLFVWDKG